MINKKYSEKHLHFIDLEVPKLLEELLKSFDKSFSIVDLGCGDDKVLWSLYNKGLLKNAEKIVGVDISGERINRLVSDVQDLKIISDESFDIAISSQVIEHVPDDFKMLKEAYRILKPDGFFYVSTVIKKWYGFWIYWNNGFKLDPTHLREYKSEQEFLELLEHNGLTVKDWKLEGIYYPITDLALRTLTKLNLINLSSDFYQKHKTLRKLRKFKLKIIGYKTIEVITRKN